MTSFRTVKKRILVVALVFSVFCVFLVLPPKSIQAVNNRVMFHVTHVFSTAGDYNGAVSRFDLPAVANLSGIRDATVSQLNVTQTGNAGNYGEILNDPKTPQYIKNYGSIVYTDLVNNPAVITMIDDTSHGDPRSLYTTMGPNMAELVRANTQAAQTSGSLVYTVVDCCGSGNLAKYSKDLTPLLGDGQNNMFVITSSAPGQESTTGGGNSVAEAIAFYRDHINDKDSSGNRINDKNGDGVLDVSEFRDASVRDSRPFQVLVPPGNEDSPVLGKDKETLDEYVKKWRGLCGVVKPGQDKAFNAMWGTAGIGDFKNHRDVNGKEITPATRDNIEDELNYNLRMANFGCLIGKPVNGSTDALTTPGCDPSSQDGSNYSVMKNEAKDTKITWVSGNFGNSLTRDQAQQSLKDANHAYSVPDRRVKPFLYIKGSTNNSDADGKPVMIRRSDCKFTDVPLPLPMPSPNPNANNNPFNNGQGNNGGQQNPSNNQNGQASPSPSPGAYINSNVVCPQTYAPVCDTNNQTQPNECVATQQKKVTIKHTGACTDADKKFTNISGLSDLIKQVVTSGIPDNKITSIVQAIIKLFSGYMTETTTTSGTATQ